MKEYYIYVDGAPKGPFTLEQLAGNPGITDGMTPVWYQGLPDWMPISMAPDTAALFAGRSQTAQAPTSPTAAHARPVHNAPAAIKAAEQSTYRTQDPHMTATATVQRPRSYLAGSIIVAVLGCPLTAIIAIIYAVKTRTALRYGEYEPAERYSERSQLWIIISIVLGLVTGYFQTMYMLGIAAAG